MKKQNRVAFFNILSTVLLRSISVFTAPVISRLLGDSDYGIVSIYTIWVSAAAIVFPLESQATLVNSRVEYPEEVQPKYQSSTMFLSILSFLCFSAVILLFIHPISNALQLHWGVILLILFHAFGTFSIGFLGNKFTYELKADKNFLMSVGVAISTFVLSVGLILLMPQEIKYYGRLLGLAATYGIIGIGACIYILAKGKTLYNREYWKFCLTLSLPMIFYNLSDLLLGQCDRLMLQHMMSESMVGQYSMALNIGGLMFSIFGALNSCWTPFFFDDMKNGKLEEAKTPAKNFLELFTVLSVGFILLHREVYHIFIGQEFWDGTDLIPVFVTSYFLNFLCTFPVNYEYYRKKTKMVAVVTILSSLVNIGLNYILIQTMGMMGAALATAISHCLQLSFHYGYCRFVLDKKDYPFGIGLWGKYALVYLGVVVITYLTPDAWLLRWGSGAAIGLWELYRIKQRKVLI